MKCTAMFLAALVATFCVLGNAAKLDLVSRTPVERVVNLLKDLKTKLAADEKTGQQAYDKYACWCEKTTGRKAKAIEQAQLDLRSLGQIILITKGRVATLISLIETLNQDMKANKEARDQATVLREKENAAYTAETAEMKQTIYALQKAITVLVEGSSPSLLQASEKAKVAVRAVVGAMPAYTSLKSGQLKQLESFLQSSTGTKYMPQSLTVQGILTDMYSTFTSDLESATVVEATSQKDFENFIAVKTDEYNSMAVDKAAKEKEKAEKEAQLADTQQIYDDTTSQKEADILFFDQTKSACVSKHEEWSTRSSLREEELAGITQAIEILSRDSSRDLFASAIKAGKETGADDSYDTGRDISFLQVASVSAPALQAYKALKMQATAAHSFRLAALAVTVREAKVGHFDQVLKAIDTMIQTLQEEGTADMKKRDQCKEEYTKIESKVKQVSWLIKKNEAKIHKLEDLIELRRTQKAETIDEIQSVDQAVQDMNSTRTAEHESFEQSKLEDQQSIDLLLEAREALMSYYKNHSIAMGPIQGAVKGLALAQQPDFDVSVDQAPDAVFSDKGARKIETKGIVQILTTIIEDLDDEIKNGMKAEESAQLEYEGLLAAAFKLRAELVIKKVSLEEAIAKRDEEKTDEEKDKAENQQELDDEQAYKKSITDDCDFVLRTFEKRAAARDAEMNGLAGAKEYLAGYKPPEEAALLEKNIAEPEFDDKVLARTRFLGLGR